MQTDFSGGDDYGFGVKVQSDGKTVVVGQSGVYPLFHTALTRYTKNGTLDRTFGTGGKVVAALDAGGDGSTAITFQPDGKIVTAGSVIHNNFVVAFVTARFNPDGSLDQTFGNNGSVQTVFGDSAAEGNDVVLQADGKIVVVGFTGAGSYSSLNNFALVRFNPDGSLDQSFGASGRSRRQPKPVRLWRGALSRPLRMLRNDRLNTGRLRTSARTGLPSHCTAGASPAAFWFGKRSACTYN